MIKKKRQHTVQKAYLEQWKVSKKFFVFDLKNKKVHPGEPKSIFRENYIYNWNDFGDEDQFIIDDLITEIENAAFPVISAITKRPIKDEEKYWLSRYISLQILRTPKQKESFHEMHIHLSKNMIIEQLKNPEKKSALLKNTPKKHHEFLEQLSSNPEKKVSELFDKKLVMKISNIREMWLQYILHFLEKLTEKNFHASWYLLQASSKTAFITSDNPVITISSINNSKKPTQNDIHFTEVTFPLSPKFMLLIKRKRSSNTSRMFRGATTESSESVRELNCRTAMFADRYIVSHSNRLLLKIAELAHTDWQEIRHDKTAFDLRSKGLIPDREAPKNKSIRLFDRFQ